MGIKGSNTLSSTGSATFTSTKATTGNGGAFFAQGTNTVNLASSSFQGCQARSGDLLLFVPRDCVTSAAIIARWSVLSDRILLVDADQLRDVQANGGDDAGWRSADILVSLCYLTDLNCFHVHSAGAIYSAGLPTSINIANPWFELTTAARFGEQALLRYASLICPFVLNKVARFSLAFTCR